MILNSRTQSWQYRNCRYSNDLFLYISYHLWHRNVLNGLHHEDWYRINVYGDLFDLIFVGQSGYETKRMDFIFSHTDGFSDAFYCEDKPNNNDLKDQKKTKNVREQSLKYWSSLLPYPECISYIAAITCQFQKLNMHVTGKINISKADKKGASVAEYLAIVISLVRMAIGNFEIINIITNIKKEDDLAFLSSLSTQNPCFRDDSYDSSNSSASHDSSSASYWESKEKKTTYI
ncbi:MAG: hypothetical protein EXX96DRAFT_539482 [Benjaminiella poitrasii]|nr:MAG: hypothetical protein EXX96DRAFT_539482 [Benjaminiella poitrasii]